MPRFFALICCFFIGLGLSQANDSIEMSRSQNNNVDAMTTFETWSPITSVFELDNEITPSSSLPSKRQILKKIKRYLKNEHDSPETAFDYFDRDSNEKLDKSEIKSLLQAAKAGGFFKRLVSKHMVKELDMNKDRYVDWPEFEGEVEKLMADD